MHKKFSSFLLLLLSLFLSGCATGQIDVSSTPNIILPAQTPYPTITPPPSLTPTSIYSELPVISPFNASQLTEVARLTKGVIVQSMWVPDGKRIIVATKAGVYLYDVATGAELHFFDAGAPAVSAISADGQLLATARGFDVTIWGMKTGQELYHLIQGDETNKIESLVFSPKGHILAVENSVYSGDIESGPQSRNVQIWDGTGGELVYTLKERSRPAFSPNNSTLAVFFDGQVEFWKPDTFELTNSISGGEYFFFSPNSSSIVITSSERTSDEGYSADLWDLTDWQKRCSFDKVDSVTNLSFSADEKLFAVASKPGFAQVWDTATCQPLYSISGHQGCIDFVFNPDGRFLITYGMLDRTVKVWDTNTGEPLQTINGFYGDLGDFSPDGKFLIEKQWFNGTIALWDIGMGKIVSVLDRHTSSATSVDFSQDGEFIVVGEYYGNVRLWSVQTGEIQKTFQGPSYIKDVSFSPDGQIVAATGIIYQGNDAEAKMQWWDISSGSSLYEWQTALASNLWEIAAVFSPDGKTFAALSIGDNILRLWDTATRQIRYTFILVDDQSERGFAFTPDSQTIAIATSDRFVKFWDIYSGQQTRVFLSLPGDTEKVNHLVFSPDGHLLIAASYKTVWIADVEKKALITSFQFDHTYIRKIAISPDGKILAFTSNDGIHLLDLSTQQILASQTNFSDLIPDLDFSPDGRLLATAGTDGTVRLWGIKP